MSTFGLERGFAVGVGAVLIALGLAGSLANPIVGRPDTGALLATGAGHDLVHIISGALFVHVGLALNGTNRAYALMALGGVFLVGGLISVISPDVLGLYGASSSGLGQLAHVVLGVAAIVIGAMGRGGEPREVGRRASRPARG